MTLTNEADIFFSWEDASQLVGDEKVLREIDQLFFHFAGFASVEVKERAYERVYVDGYLRLYPTDVKALKRGESITCNSALIDHNMSIDGVIREDFFQKFLVFDEELLIGLSVEKGDNAFNYPADISLHQGDLQRMCTTIGIASDVPGKISPQSEPLDSDDVELEKLNVIGALACMLAMNNDLEGSLQDGQHISEIIIDDLFTMMEGLGANVDGKKKFLYERIISKGVKSILES